MINKLTEAQRAKFPEFVEKWLKIGLSTEPIDFEKAKKAVRLAYKCGGLEPPTEIIYCASPMDAQRKIAELSGKKEFVSTTFDGQHDVNYCSFYDFFQKECGIKLPKFRGIMAITEECGWVYGYDTICFVCDRHTVLNRDSQNRLHSVDGPAVSYPDGYSVYAVHGIRIPAWIILEKEKITIEKILTEQNAEVRQAMMEVYGRVKMLESEDCKVIDQDLEWGTLYRTQKLTDCNGDPFCFLHVVNSTPEADGTWKSYILLIDPAINTAYDAWQSTFPGIKDFIPIAES